ncbi:MAG: LamG-like jellyroll fold domain-containing protein [Myxococcota bacterium]
MKTIRQCGVLLLGLGVAACALDTTGLGPGTPAPSSGSSTAGPQPTTDPESDTSTGAADALDSGTTTNEPTTSGNLPPIESTSQGDTEGDSSTGTPDSTLVDTGLLARWTIDDTTVGQTPTVVSDTTALPLDLDLLVHSGSPQLVTLDGHQGLSWSTQGEDGRAMAWTNDTKLTTDLDGSHQITLELVVSVQTVSGWASRLLHIGTANRTDLAVGAASLDELQIRWDNVHDTRLFAADLDGERQVIHVVLDTDHDDPEERILAYIDGVPLAPAHIHPSEPAFGEGMTLSSGSALVLGNRTDGDRSFSGQLYYAAIYTEALDPDEVMLNTSILAQDDDSPTTR